MIDYSTRHYPADLPRREPKALRKAIVGVDYLKLVYTRESIAWKYYEPPICNMTVTCHKCNKLVTIKVGCKNTGRERCPICDSLIAWKPAPTIDKNRLWERDDAKKGRE